MKSVDFIPLDWDTDILGFSCGAIELLSDAPHNNNNVNDNDQDQIKSEILKIINNKTRFISFKIPHTEQDLLNFCLSNSGTFIDSELTFKLDTTLNKSNFNLDKHVVFTNKLDQNYFSDLALEMRYSRFFLDKHIGVNAASKLWQTSLENYCKGRADQLAVIYYDNNPAGFIVISIKDNKHLYLNVIGVLPHYQGKGLGKKLLESTLNKYANEYAIYVETQPKNSHAINLYQHAGFNLDNMTYIVHFWNELS